MLSSSSNNGTNKETCIEAINLRTRKLNGFKLLTVFSREYGLIKLSGSKLGGRSEPFVHNLYWIGNSKSEIHSIKHSEFKGQFRNITTDLDKLSLAWQYAEFLEACSHHQEERSSEIFDLFQETLSQLAQAANNDFAPISNNFFWHLSELLGYKASLTLCDQPETNCALKSRPESVEAWFDFEHGGILCSACKQRPSGDCIRVLPGIYKLLNILENSNQKTNTNNSVKNIAAEDFVTNILQKHLQKHTDRKMKSTNISKHLKSGSKA